MGPGYPGPFLFPGSPVYYTRIKTQGAGTQANETPNEGAGRRTKTQDS